MPWKNVGSRSRKVQKPTSTRRFDTETHPPIHLLTIFIHRLRRRQDQSMNFKLESLTFSSAEISVPGSTETFA